MQKSGSREVRRRRVQTAETQRSRVTRLQIRSHTGRGYGAPGHEGEWEVRWARVVVCFGILGVGECGKRLEVVKD